MKNIAKSNGRGTRNYKLEAFTNNHSGQMTKIKAIEGTFCSLQVSIELKFDMHGFNTHTF